MAAAFDQQISVVDSSGQPVWQFASSGIQGGLVAADLDADGAVEMLVLDSLAETSLRLFDGVGGGEALERDLIEHDVALDYRLPPG